MASMQSAVFKTITQSASASLAILETLSPVAVSCCLVACYYSKLELFEISWLGRQE